MRERAEISLKIICWLLVAVLLFQLVRAFVHNFPFTHVTIPEVPTLSASTNAVTGMAMNPAMPANVPQPGTPLPGTNLVARRADSSVVAPANGETNLPPVLAVAGVATNFTTLTNSPGQTNPGVIATNRLTASDLHKKSARSHHPMMAGGFLMPGMGPPLPDLPPLMRARIDRIVDSELLGPVSHPLPMGLMGIAGDVAFLRTASGQTGLVKEGDTLGDLKLVRIGINRVLIEKNGQKQELTIFDGMGGESLLTSDTNSNEITKH